MGGLGKVLVHGEGVHFADNCGDHFVGGIGMEGHGFVIVMEEYVIKLLTKQ